VKQKILSLPLSLFPPFSLSPFYILYQLLTDFDLIETVLAVSQMNSDATLVLLFLYKLIDVFKEYFKEVEEESIRDNFVITYELLDEMMDFGYPQATEAALLKE
jgi:hypothetical protein